MEFVFPLISLGTFACNAFLCHVHFVILSAQDTSAATMAYRQEFEKNAIQKMVNLIHFDSYICTSVICFCMIGQFFWSCFLIRPVPRSKL